LTRTKGDHYGGRDLPETEAPLECAFKFCDVSDGILYGALAAKAAVIGVWCVG